MYLEQVKIKGFKSYAVPVTISFKPGIGVIVGNNGVGKSNILDALAWGLGESDLKKLRCYSRDELFFAGSREYPPAELIEVTLVVSTATDKSAPRTTISRQADRQGKEVFRLNGEVVLPEVFKNTLGENGLANATKTLIRQERINDFVHLSPGERLNYLTSLLGSEATDVLLRRIEDSCRDYFAILVPGGGVHFSIGEGEESGLYLKVAFPGKGLREVSSLSGGEKTMCSLAINLAIFEQLNSPFYLLDEVEPSLDWANHQQMQALLKKLCQTRQLIMITHLRSTIEMADTIYGIRARKDGASIIKFYFQMNDRLLRAFKCC